MHSKEGAHNPEAMQMERRKFIRHAVDEEAAVQLVSSGERIDCRVVDIGMTGCRVRAGQRFNPSPKARVEVSLKVRGIAFRFSGELLWSDNQQLAGIHLHDLPARRRTEFAELLCEVQADNSAKTRKPSETARPAVDLAQAKPAFSATSSPPAAAIPPPLAAAKPAGIQPAEAFTLARRSGPLGPPVAAPPSVAKPQAAQTSAAKPAEGSPAAPPPAGQPNAHAQVGGRDRRAQARHEVDTSAIILLVNISAKIKGRIIDLSLGGCRIRTDERFPVGIYTRIETDFFLEGLPFRLGGVVQAIQGKDLVGIRFLDMSERKKDQLKQLIAEIDEMEASKKLNETATSPAASLEPTTAEGGSI